MLTVLRLIAARHLALAKVRSLLTLLGISIGVSAVVGITALNGAVLDAFNNMVESISRGTDLQISAGEAGVPDSVLDVVREVPGVASASPLLENTVQDPETGDRILVLGIDFLADDPFRGLAEKEGGKNIVDDEVAFLNSPRAILIAGPYAQSRQLQKGQTIKLVTPSGPLEFEVFGLLAPTGAAKAFGGNVGIMGMDAAQLTFGKVGRYDRIDVDVVDTEKPEVVRDRIRTATKSGFVVDRPKDRGVRVSRMVFALQTGLQLTSAVALLVGVFVVFNTMAIAILQRRRELATLRALGTTRLRVTLLVAGEAAILGMLGGILGVFIGRGMAHLALGIVADAISALYVEVKPTGAEVSPTLALVGFLLGLGCAIVGATRPAWKAAGLSPVIVLAGRATHSAPPKHPLMLFAIGLVGYVLSFPVSNLPAPQGMPVFGYLSSFMVLLGTALMGPLILHGVKIVMEPLATRLGSVVGHLAAENLVRDLSRASVTSAALMFGLALSIGVGSMVHSFKVTMDAWLQASVPSDLFVSAGSQLADQKNIPLKPELGDGIEKIPGVDKVFHVRMAQIPYEDLTIQVVSQESEVFFERARLIIRDGPSRIEGDMLRRTGGVTISENLAQKKGLKAGDSLVLGTPDGPRAFPILAVAVDFTSDQGFALMDRQTYVEAFGDTLVDMFQLYLKPGANLEAVRKELAATVGRKYGLNVVTNQEFRDYVGGLVDNAFKITSAIQLVALLVALLGIINTLLASVLDRTREIGVLRAIGTLRNQVNLLMVLEAMMLGLGGAIMATVGGLAFGYIFVMVINVQSTGWSLPFAVPWRTVGEAFAISVLAAGFASLVPARRAGRLDIKEALAEE
ncbi:MAG: ABC transporter permease [Myxococcota bacterium]